MPYLQLNDTRFPLREGSTRVGSGPSADVRLPIEGPGDAVDAVFVVGADRTASVRRESPNATIEVNGVALGGQPTPLFHGDRISISGVPLLYADEARAGLTTEVPVVQVKEAPPQETRGATRARSGGRLISLTDGREYTVRSDGLTIGRDAGCDIVVSASQVSRRHARIELRTDGYVLVDLSTNGVLVNGVRVDRTRALERGDRIAIGPEEFRFHGSAESAEPVPAPPPVILATPPAPAAVPVRSERTVTPPARPAVAEAAPEETAASTLSTEESPVATRDAMSKPPPARPVLATLESLNPGPGKGALIDIRSPLSHVGRGAHNDVIIPDESVSDSHAKLQRREAGWFVVDLGSTNGTYVSGQRVEGDAVLPADADVRFGGVKYRFRPVTASAEEGGGTRVVVGYRPRTPKSATAVEAGGPGPDTAEAADGRRHVDEPEQGIPRILLGGLLLLAFVVIYLILQTL